MREAILRVVAAVTGFYDRHCGGLLPYITARREVSPADGAFYELRLTLFRRSFDLVYQTPRTPRAVARQRRHAALLARAAAEAAQQHRVHVPPRRTPVTPPPQVSDQLSAALDEAPAIDRLMPVVIDLAPIFAETEADERIEFHAAADRVGSRIVQAGGEVTATLYVNQTIRALLPAWRVAEIGDDADVASVRMAAEVRT